MKVQNLENAKQSLLEVYLELDDSTDENDSETDLLVNEIINQKSHIQSIIGILDVSIAKLNRTSQD